MAQIWQNQGERSDIDYRWSNKSGNVWNIELRVNTELVLGLPKTKQVGLEHAKNNPKEVWALACGPTPPPWYEHAHGFNSFFWEPFPNIKC